MAIWQVTIQKAIQSEYWTNRYFVDTATIEGAETVGLQIVEAERAAHATYVEFVSMRTSTPAVDNPSVYLVKELTGVGARTVTTVLPLTVTTNIVMQTGPRRPDRKFYRGCAQASDIATVSTFNTTYTTALTAGLCADLFEITPLCSATGEPYTAIPPSQKIGQHQLTRGTRKKTQPIIPVS